VKTIARDETVRRVATVPSAAFDPQHSSPSYIKIKILIQSKPTVRNRYRMMTSSERAGRDTSRRARSVDHRRHGSDAMQVAALSSRITNTLRLTPNRAAGDVKPRSAVIECAHKKGTGSTKNGRDSNPKYLGVKKYGEEKVQVGSIIVRQRGNKVRFGRW